MLKAAVSPPAAEAEPVAEVIPPHIQALIENPSPGAKEFGEGLLAQHRATQAALSEVTEFVAQQKFNAVVEHFAANIVAVQENFVVLAEVEQPGADGKVTKVVVEQPVSDAMMDKVSDWYVQNPEAAKFLTVEEVTRRVYPNVAKRSAKVAPSVTPANPAQDVSGRKVVKVGSPSGSGPVANGAAAGRVPRAPAPPPPNETMEQTIARGAKALGLG